MLEWLADRYGPYPFPSAGVVLVDSESAMETQQMVTFGAGRGGGPADIDRTTETLLHEYAHQWFGNAVTPKDWNALWLNEGWAMYTEMLWTIDQGYLTDAEWVTWARAADAASRPIAGPPGRPDPDHFAESNVYVGPAMMLRAIHKAVGDEAFFALGRDWVQEQRNHSGRPGAVHPVREPAHRSGLHRTDQQLARLAHDASGLTRPRHRRFGATHPTRPTPTQPRVDHVPHNMIDPKCPISGHDHGDLGHGCCVRRSRARS